jgi:protein TonB
MRQAVAVGLATATMGHALLLLGLGWVASLARSAPAPDQGEAVPVEVATPNLALDGDGSLRPAIAPGDGSTATGARVASIRRTARSRRPGRIDPPPGPTMRPASTIVPAVTVGTEPPAPAVLSAVPAPAVSGDVGRSGGESPAMATSTRGARTPGAATSPAGGPGAPSSTAGVRYRTHPSPPYPIDSLRRREEGVVLLSVDIGPDGRATRVSLSRGSGSPSLDSAAVEAVYSWTFEPARSAGAAVASSAVIPVRFSLVGR